MNVSGTYPTWKNTYADVLSSSYGRTTAKFFDSVICPAIAKLQHDIETYNASEDPLDAFRESDTQELIVECLKAFCPSLNSLWERQLRSVMAGVARELYDDVDLIKKCQTRRWDQLDELFEHLRGHKLSDFKTFNDPDTLQLMANVCRHGTGPSRKGLSEKCPELWPELGPPMPGLHDGEERDRLRTYNFLITLQLLEHLSDAIQSFWNQSQYIYLESLERKHEHVVKKLEELRPIWHR
jgi:hypothetical protein